MRELATVTSSSVVMLYDFISYLMLATTKNLRIFIYMITKEEITNKLKESKASAVIIVENANDMYKEEGYREVMTAVYDAEDSPSPYANKKAEDACFDFLVENPELALEEIQKRIDARSGLKSAPLSAGAKRALEGRD